ncbi:MAG: cysteine desulfurase, partial [Comamonas sp.]
MFSATPPSSIPGVANGLVPGAQFPANIAPPGSPLASPAGLGPSVPGTAIPQGQIPGGNLVPASPTQLPSLAHRAPALLPHAVAGNGVPDTVYSVAPALEPRSGSTVLGVPQQVHAPVAPQSAAAASPFYFLNSGYGHPSASTPTQLPVERPSLPQALPMQPPAASSADPKFYFVDAVVLPSGHVTPAKPSPQGGAPLVAAGQRQPFDVNAVRRDFPILQERVNGKPLVW